MASLTQEKRQQHMAGGAWRRPCRERSVPGSAGARVGDAQLCALARLLRQRRLPGGRGRGHDGGTDARLLRMGVVYTAATGITKLLSNYRRAALKWYVQSVHKDI